MLKRVLGRMAFFARLSPSKLPSRDPASLLLGVSGSANMIDPLLLLGDGGPRLCWLMFGTVARLGRFNVDNSFCLWASAFAWRAASLGVFASSGLAKGLRMLIRLVGRDAVHRARLASGGAHAGVANVAVAMLHSRGCRKSGQQTT